jgi:Fe(3+) dicitrate transport protein
MSVFEGIRSRRCGGLLLVIASFLLPAVAQGEEGSASRGETAAAAAEPTAAAPADETSQPATAAAPEAAAPDAAPAAAAPATADQIAAATPPGELVLFEKLSVVGSAAAVRDVPGAAHYLDHRELERQDYADIHRTLLHVPGVYVQEEEGFGLRPNISIRGTGGERSSKITILEDGVLVAPAPYAAPAAYYFPTAGRMRAIEIRKGSSSVRQGPYTNGGVLNLISTPIPGGFSGEVEAFAGEHATQRLHAHAGGLLGADGRWGWLVETFQHATDGFKRLDGGGDTGFELSDYLGKLRWTSGPDARVFHAVDVKVGKTEQEGDETYLGLTESDFRADPLRRYAGSQVDEIDTDHEQVQLRWLVAPRDGFEVATTVYRNDFFRNWYKLGSVGGVDIADVLGDPAAHADELAVVRGEVDSAPGALAVRANRRDYYSLGVESVATWRFAGAGARHELDFGVRVHEDEEDRFQEDDRYQMVDGRMVRTGTGAPGSNANRVTSAEAVAFFLQDRVAAGRWTLTPGVRVESIDFLREDWGRVDPARAGAPAERENDADVVIPGLGVSYRLSEATDLFAGVHRGFAPPGPGQDAATEPEDSVNYELGVRSGGGAAAGLGSSGYQVVAFLNDYTNLLGRDTLSGGGSGSGDLFNGGAVEVRGLEASADAEIGRLLGRDLPFEVPIRAAYTFTEATFESGFTTDFPAWGPIVEPGDELPYVPQHQLSLGAGVRNERFRAFVDVSWQDEMRTVSGSGAIPAGEGTDARWLVDLSGQVRLFGQLHVLAQVRNVTDEVYVAARQPAGARPGLSRTALLGLRWGF